MQVRKANQLDVGIIKTLAEQIWPSAYGAILQPEQITYMLELIYSKEALLNQMQQGQQFILAMLNNNAIGFAAYSKKNNESTIIYRLNKLYTLPQQSVKGIGSFLLENICCEVALLGATQIELNVNKYNTATEFYAKKGFTIVREEVIEIGNNYIMDDYVMVKNV